MNEKMPEFGWWIEIITIKPICIYYFGVFSHISEAKKLKTGYIEDLEAEKAEIVNIEIKQCQPNNLTIYTDRNKINRTTAKQSINKYLLVFYQSGAASGNGKSLLL